jgi:flagellar motor protein MotB
MIHPKRKFIAAVLFCAAAVIKVLVQQMGIDPKRLAPHGAGPFAPVATNKTEEGRAHNRRVELVEQSS